MSWLWPIKTGKTFFDVWSVCHCFFWVVLGFNWGALAPKHKWMALAWLPFAVTLVLALLWEVAEKWYFEPHGWVLHPEVWYNRWLSDPLVGLIGMGLGLWLVSKQ